MTKQRFKKLRTFGRRACTVALSMALAVGVIPAMNSVKVKADENQLGKEVYEEIASMSSKNPGTIFKPGYKEVDPYGYGVGEKFYLNTENELIFFDTLYESNVEVYENLKTSPLSDISNSLNKELRNQLLKDSKVTNDYGNPASSLNYVQMVSFDPTKSGRKDHLAVIGVNDSKKLMLYVADLRHETK